MDDFTGLLARDFGLKPQGKSAPMAPQSNSSAADFNIFASSYSFANSAGKKSDSSPVFDDLGRDGDDFLFKDVFSGPTPKYGSSSGDSRSPSAPSFDYDAMFKEPQSKSASMPVYDKPVYDDEDVFEAIPELKVPSTSSQSARFEDVFSSISSSPAKHRKQNSSPFDDLMGNDLGNREIESDREHKASSIFDDLIPGFGRTSSPPPKRSTSDTSQSQNPPYQTAKTSSNLVEEDPFVVLEESASTPRETPMGGFTDPLEEISKFNSSSRKPDHSSVRGGVFVDIDPLDSLGKSGPDLNSRSKSHLRPPGNISGSQSPVESSASYHSKKVSFDDDLEPQNTSAPPPTNTNGSFESTDDVWLTVSEIPLFTQPTSAPPPARPPPPRPTRPVKKKLNEPSISSSTEHHSHVPSSDRASVNNPTASQMDELDDFSMGRNQTAANGHPDPPSGEDSDVFSAAVASAAAMKDAMDKAEAKFRHAKERREKENLKASRSREGDHTENHDSRERELRERQVRLERERAEMEKAQEKEREEREREQKRIERERERLLARQAVERATREARERAAAEAHAKVQRAAVGKASDARERAERAAVQRAHAEARERAAAGAREKAEKAAAEAREKAENAAAETRERANADAREKEARVRTERAAVERAAAEARGRAAAHAKAAQAKAKQQQQENNNDLDSFFNSVSRPSSAPRQRTNPQDPFQDSWNKGGSFESSRASSRVPSGATENLRKGSSATNIADDLSSIFGASQSGGFQDVDGETEERRRARLERHQRTQERAAKALAEKNERDRQVQREQVEKDRIGVTLDVEIKRWGAGKEGNLRALLSTLQYVLWPECGWQPVSLTDLITGASVKKVYRKATLCIHPDKVQQKGANLQQRYIAEKVFDMLKEAWNKFNSEELF